MAKQRYVNTFFWDDSYIEGLPPHGKLLFIYLLTTPLTNIAGSFEITVKKMHAHTDISREEITELLERFEMDGKIMYRDSWILMLNAIEHQTWQTHATIRTGIANIVNASPQWVKDRLCIAYEWLSHLNLNSNLNSNSKDGETPVAAVAAVEADPVERRIWTDGVELLTRSGQKETAARSYLGRLIKDHSRERVAEAIAICQAANAADPKAYMIGVLQERATAGVKERASVGKHDKCPLCSTAGCLGGMRADYCVKGAAAV